MAQDSEGFDLDAVGVPITGFAAVQLDGEPAFLASAEVTAEKITVPTGYEKIGLFKEDGGPALSADDEDATPFFQEGYKLAGDTTLTVQIGLAEMNSIVRRLTTGHTPDGNGMITVDRNIPDAKFPLLTVTKFKNGATLVRNGMARISAVEADQEERGSVNGKATTFEWVKTVEVGGFFREWLLQKADATAPETPAP